MNILGKYFNKKLDMIVDNGSCFEDNEYYIAIDSNLENMTYINEVIEKYKKIGMAFLNELEIKYAIYFYDKKNDRFIVAKDMTGLNRVYYYTDGKTLYVCNDIIELVKKYNLNKVINEDALSIYFRYHYINPPQTIFKNIFKLEHGQYLVYENNEIKIETYWDTFQQFNINKNNKINDYETCKKELQEILENYIKNIVNTDKNYGIYLSGGIDSSLVTAVLTKYSNKRVNTFSIGFFEEKYNEAEKSKRIAEYLGTNHHELYIDEEKLLSIIKKIPSYYTEPFADPSELPTILLNEFAKNNNIQIALTGDGADQLFCGTGIYDTIWKIQKLHQILNPFNIYINPKLLKNNRKLIYLFSNSNKKYRGQSEVSYDEIFLKGLFKDTGRKRLIQEEKIESNNWQERRLILDFDTFTCDDINIKMGVAASKNNIEINSPFLNKELIEYSFKIPHRYKYYNKIKKYILKEILYGYIPKELLDNNKKGFAIPTHRWLKTHLNNDLRRVSSKEFIEKQNIFDYDVINKLLNNIDDKKLTHILWDYYMFQIWYECYIL